MLRRMRHSWAAYVTGAREAAGLSKAELGRRIGVARETISRWESGSQHPDSATVVRDVARALGRDPQEALVAAGMLPAEPTARRDPELERIRASRLAPEVKEALVQHVMQRRAREERARLDDLEVMIRNMGG